MNTPLPDLTSAKVQQPLRHSASCASLSLALLETLNNVLPRPPSLSFSVGSGPGLIEALLLHHFPLRAAHTEVIYDDEDDSQQNSDEVRKVPTGSFYGIEVKNAKEVNRYLPPQHVLTVPGTWALPGEEITERVEGLLFIYPRQVGLIHNYLEKCTALRVVVWIGPRCDVDEFITPLERWGLRDSSGSPGDGLAEADVGSPTEIGSWGGSGGRAKLVEDGEVVLVYRRKPE
ncbi:hypothetical protein QBC37DRAFT_169305 [Rhypophila decipiens]|uniref:Uncharacterized protein n=1 Tax=Rhypophila decipiens TaxID=261697 RepID=A0AAN6Y7J4_9PEZI|nr:hypothetical protein QBC37DRAFT_169305 [Rhypophila decipiens]